MEQQNQPNSFLKYSGLVVQMGVVIGLFAFGGHKLDAYYRTNKPVFTIIFSLTGIGASLYLVLKDFIKPRGPSK